MSVSRTANVSTVGKNGLVKYRLWNPCGQGPGFGSTKKTFVNTISHCVYKHNQSLCVQTQSVIVCTNAIRQPGIAQLSLQRGTPRRSRPMSDIQSRSRPMSDVESCSQPMKDVESRSRPTRDVEKRSQPMSDVERRCLPMSDVERRCLPMSDVERRGLPMRDVNHL